MKNKLPSDPLRNLGNSPDSQVFGEFPRFQGIILGIPKISKIPVGIWGWYIFKIWEISQMTGYLGNLE